MTLSYQVIQSTSPEPHRLLRTIAALKHCTRIVVVLSSFAVFAQNQTDSQLAALLADPATRAATVATLAKSGEEKIPLLLSWTRETPPGVSEYQLYIGLADAFARLRAKEALPFLTKQIGLDRFPFTNVWTRTPMAIKERLPAVGALIQIGPEASRAVMRADPSYKAGNERLGAIFVVSQIPGVPEARAFLSGAAAQARVEKFWAEEGLKNLESTAAIR